MNPNQNFTQKYVLAHTINNMPKGYEFSIESWPLHVTLADVFAIDGDLDAMINDLTIFASESSAIQTTITSEDWFGVDKNVHVMLLDKTRELQNLHEQLLDILEKYNSTFNNPEYTREGFRPHSTVQKNERLHLQNEIVIDSISLIDMFPDQNPFNRRIIDTMPFNIN